MWSEQAMRLLVLLIYSVSLLCLSAGFDMIAGDTVHRKMVFHERIKDFAIPFKKRIKSLHYNDAENRIIKVLYTMHSYYVVSICLSFKCYSVLRIVFYLFTSRWHMYQSDGNLNFYIAFYIAVTRNKSL